MDVTPRLVDRLLSVLEDDIVPLTREGVAAGNKVFGAAVIEKETLELVLAATNTETANPLFHGEITALNTYWELADRPPPSDCIFLSTHEPCSLCLSAITWSGFDNFFYLFTYEDSRDAFAIPHDLRILAEVFGLDDGEYRRQNSFWTAYSLRDLATGDDAENQALSGRIDGLVAIYDELSEGYQERKGTGDIPLA